MAGRDLRAVCELTERRWAAEARRRGARGGESILRRWAAAWWQRAAAVHGRLWTCWLCARQQTWQQLVGMHQQGGGAGGQGSVVATAGLGASAPAC